MYRKLSQIVFFALLLLFCNVAIGKTLNTSELEGNWRNLGQENLDPIFLSFGADSSFYMESKTYWFLGSYKTEAMDETRSLILDVEDGSDPERVGEHFTYSFELEDGMLILEASSSTGVLNNQDTNGRGVYIVISNESDEDDDDDEFTIYASCFINMAHQTDTACHAPR
jgi:hypothetical protein